jgi:hypothetical protein
MRFRSFVYLALLSLFLVAPALAAEAPTAVTGSLAWQNGDETGRTWSATVDLNFPVTGLISLGPAVRASYYSADVNPDPEDTGSLSLTEIGGTFTFYTARNHDGFHFGVAAFYPMDSDTEGYLVEPYVGLEFGGDAAFFRARFSHPYHYGENGGDTLDLERDELTAGFGMRF